MAAANHLGELPFALAPVGGSASEWTDPLASRPFQGRFNRTGGHIASDRGSIFLSDTVDPECELDAACAQAAPRHRPRARFSKQAIVDITQISQPIRDVGRRYRGPDPSPLLNFTRQIRGQPSPSRREALNIAQRQIIERSAVQRRRRTAFTGHRAIIVPQSERNLNAYAGQRRRLETCGTPLANCDKGAKE